MCELALECFGNDDVGVVVSGVLAPAEVFERVGPAREDGVAVDAEVVLAAFVEALVSPFDEDFAVGVIVERTEGEVDEMTVELEVAGVGLEEFFVNEGGFVKAALHPQGGTLADEGRGFTEFVGGQKGENVAQSFAQPSGDGNAKNDASDGEARDDKDGDGGGLSFGDEH